MSDSLAVVQASIEAAFPDVVFRGPITPADDFLDDEDFDEERDLFRALNAKRWTEIPVPVIRPLAFGLSLLTEDAFSAFLPAWLKGGLEDPDIREGVVCTFDRDERERPTTFMDERLRILTLVQKEALRAYFSFLVATATSNLERESAKGALSYVEKLFREQ